MKTNDPVKHPSHYVDMACVIEPIELTGTMNSALGQILQYVIRYKLKGDPVENLEKAKFWCNWVIQHYFEKQGLSTIAVQAMTSFEDVCIRKAFHLCYRTNDQLVDTVMEILTAHESVNKQDIVEIISEIDLAIEELKVTHYE